MNALLATRPALGLTLLRVMLGSVFATHGCAKIFRAGFDGTTDFFTQIGVPLPGVMGPTVAIIEFVGGFAMILGIYPRLIAVLFAGIVAGAIFFVKEGHGFFAPAGWELEYTLCLASLALAIAGAGQWTVMELFKKKV